MRRPSCFSPFTAAVQLLEAVVEALPDVGADLVIALGPAHLLLEDLVSHPHLVLGVRLLEDVVDEGHLQFLAR